MKTYLNFIFLIFFTFFIIKIQAQIRNNERQNSHKYGILLIGHGSASEEWTRTFLEVDTATSKDLLNISGVKMVRTAFIEAHKPDISSQLRAFDSSGITDIIAIPLLLTASTHYSIDIPRQLGLIKNSIKHKEFEDEKEVFYQSKAKIHLNKPLDFGDVLKKNILRRFSALSQSPKEEALLMVAYGEDHSYLKDWTNMLNKAGKYVKKKCKINQYDHTWCGHIVNYNPEVTTSKIKYLLERNKRVIVIPVMVSKGFLQNKIIMKGVENANAPSRIIYRPDSILPDKDLNNWVISCTKNLIKTK